MLYSTAIEFDEKDYVQKYKYINNNSSKVKITTRKSKIIRYPDFSRRSKISGAWLRFPKLHYYIFNYIVEINQKNEDLVFLDKLNNFDREKTTIIIVTHEISRTGAPILALEVAKKLLSSNNIFIISLKNGPLKNEFKKYSNLFSVIDVQDKTGKKKLSYYIKLIKLAYNDVNAIVNSVCSHETLEAFHDNKIRTNILIHEFASYIKDVRIFSKCFKLAERVIYPAQIVLENTKQSFPKLNTTNAMVEPQGFIPSNSNEDLQEIANKKSNSIITVVGIGTIEFRKGVDLFISTAQIIINKKPQSSFKFLWVGGGMLHESVYKVYLIDQIERAGLSEIVSINDPVDNLDPIYRNADIFFLSSRLDPLPLVSIEAMNYGIPLVCFDNATGIAQYLSENKLTSYGVANYLDVNNAAMKIMELIDNKNLRFDVGSAQKELVKSKFNMNKYVEIITNNFKK